MQQAVAIEEKMDGQVRCRYCHSYFKPQPEYKRESKTIMRITVCPVCGNGYENRLSLRWYRDHRGRGGRNG